MKKVFEPLSMPRLSMKNRPVRSATWEGIAERILSQLMDIDEDVDDEFVLYFRASTLRFISNEEIPWTLDGEFGGESCDTEIGICSRAVTFFVGDDAPYNDEEIRRLFTQDQREVSETIKED